MKCLFIGQYLARITEGLFTDVFSTNGVLYACVYGLSERARILKFEYDEGDTWELKDVIKAPCDGFISISVRIIKQKLNFMFQQP